MQRQTPETLGGPGRFASIYELCQLLVEKIADWPSPGMARGATLVSLACVSKLFSHLALDELWRALYSLYPMLFLLPPDSYSRLYSFRDGVPRAMSGIVSNLALWNGAQT